MLRQCAHVGWAGARPFFARHAVYTILVDGPCSPLPSRELFHSVCNEYVFLMSHQRKINWSLLSLPLLALYWAALAVATHLPAVVVPQTRLTDKTIHFIAFFGLSLLLGLAFWSRRPWSLRSACSVVILIAIYAAVDELTQGLVPGRYPDLRDWYFDVGGAVCAVAVLSVAALVGRQRQHLSS